MKRISVIFLSLFFAAIINAQDVSTQQRILQHCLNIEEISATIQSQSLDREESVLMASQKFLSNQLELSVDGVPVAIHGKNYLFFMNITDYVNVEQLRIKSNDAFVHLSGTDGSRFKIEVRGEKDFQEIIRADVQKEQQQ